MYSCFFNICKSTPSSTFPSVLVKSHYNLLIYPLLVAMLTFYIIFQVCRVRFKIVSPFSGSSFPSSGFTVQRASFTNSGLGFIIHKFRVHGFQFRVRRFQVQGSLGFIIHKFRAPSFQLVENRPSTKETWFMDKQGFLIGEIAATLHLTG